MPSIIIMARFNIKKLGEIINMRTYIQDVIDLDVFDEEGKLVTQIKTVREGSLHYRVSDDNSYLVIDEALFNIPMLEKIGNKVVNDEVSDFEKARSNHKEETVIRFNKGHAHPKFKLVGRGLIYDADTACVSHDFTLIMPNVQLVDGYSLELRNNDVFTPNYTFKIDPYNDDEDIFELRLKERE